MGGKKEEVGGDDWRGEEEEEEREERERERSNGKFGERLGCCRLGRAQPPGPLPQPLLQRKPRQVENALEEVVRGKACTQHTKVGEGEGHTPQCLRRRLQSGLPACNRWRSLARALGGSLPGGKGVRRLSRADCLGRDLQAWFRRTDLGHLRGNSDWRTATFELRHA